MSLVAKDDSPLQHARILQAMVLGQDLLVAFSNGTSALLAAADIKQLALTSAVAILTEQEADEQPPE